MDINEILDDGNTTGSELRVTPAVHNFLLESTKWARFLAIMAFIFIGLGVLGMLFTFGSLASIGGSAGGLGGLMMLLYLVLIGISIIPVIYLFNFATKTRSALDQHSQQLLQEGLENHKSMFKFYGILMIIVLSFYVLGLLGALVFDATI